MLRLGENISELTNLRFARARGWRAGADRPGRYTSVSYRRVHLVDSNNDLTGIDILNPAKAAVLATAITAGGRRTPWAVRSGALTYVAEPALDDGNGNGFDRSFAGADIGAWPRSWTPASLYVYVPNTAELGGAGWKRCSSVPAGRPPGSRRGVRRQTVALGLNGRSHDDFADVD